MAVCLLSWKDREDLYIKVTLFLFIINFTRYALYIAVSNVLFVHVVCSIVRVFVLNMTHFEIQILSRSSGGLFFQCLIMTKMLFFLTFESESWVISVFLAGLEAAVL